MSLRTRLTLLAAAAVAVAVALASAGVYVATRSVLRDQVDDALRRDAKVLAHADLELAEVDHVFADRLSLALPRGRFGTPRSVVQVIGPEGVEEPVGHAHVDLPASDRAREVAAGTGDAFYEDVDAEGTHVRVLTAPLLPGFAVQLARPLDEVDRTLRRLAFVLFGFGFAGIALGALLGRGVAEAALGPLRTLTETTEQVAETRDLSHRVAAPGRDELGRLAASFNAMLGALERSLGAQRQLVADASHELRTPLATLRTNIEVLAREENLPADERERLLGDVVAQLEELTALVGDVVELARDGELPAALEDVRLDELVAAEVERARRHAPALTWQTSLEPTVVRGSPERLSRAVANLLDNAAKWSPPDGTVEVAVAGTTVTVRDHGAGIADEDLPYVFDRFYRARAARGLPGSGLGLAIVRQVATAHGGTVVAEQAEGGGARFRLELPRLTQT